MKYIYILLLCLSVVKLANTQDTSELIFRGEIDVDGMMIDFVIKTKTNAESVQSELYLPGSFLYAQKIKETIITEDSLKFYFPKMQAELIGSYGMGGIDAKWYQGGKEYQVEMDLASSDDIAFLERPQTPQAPYPYVEKDICIENKKGESTLCGTLTMPDELNSHPLVILITGSGSQDRNEEIGGHKPFLVIADYLTKCGFAVFRYDDRGFGQSKGDMKNATTYDFMTDAAAVLHFFGDYPNIDSESIGIMGHSEGGMIAWMLGAKYPKDIAYIISLAGPGVDIIDLMLKQTLEVYLLSEIEEDDLEWMMAMQEETYQIALNSKSSAEIREQLTGLFAKYGKDLSEEKKTEYGMTEANLNVAVMQLSSTWLKYFLKFEPSKYIKKIKCPILAINGTRDIQVTSKENLKGIQESINPRKCKALETHELEGLNHLFQMAEEGTIQEYYYLQETFSIEALKVIEDFMNRNH